MMAVFKREIKTYFLTPTGYIFMSLFLFISGIFFSFWNLFSLNPKFAGYLGDMLFIFLLVVPILTMRLFSEEYRQKTDQLLFTSPVSVAQIVVGKFFAAVVLFLVTLMGTGIYVLIISLHGTLDIWETVGSYIGFISLGCVFISIGLFISSTTENQLSSAVITFTVLLLFWIMDLVSLGVPAGKTAGLIFAAALCCTAAWWIYASTRNMYIAIGFLILAAAGLTVLYFFRESMFLGLIGKTLRWISPVQRYERFSMGILEMDTVVYYLSLTGFSLFLTVRLIEKKRWV